MIVKTPNPVLTTPAKPVKKIDKKTKEIIRALKENLLSTKNPKGVGLAAPQIGISLRIFITRPKEDSPIEVFINPQILWKSEETSTIERPYENKPSDKKENKLEGCLSIPNVWGNLKRSVGVKLRYTDTEGKIQEKEFTGFMATIIQHETDHLDGVLFTKRVLEQKEKLFQIEQDEKGNEKLEEIDI